MHLTSEVTWIRDKAPAFPLGLCLISLSVFDNVGFEIVFMNAEEQLEICIVLNSQN